MSACVTAGGRVFYVFDEASPASILSPSRWSLIARDAFNGTILWKRPIATWHTQLWPLKSGPAQLPRRLVSNGPQVYVTLSYDGPVTVLDAVTGKTVRTLDDTKGTEEIIFKDGMLVVLVNPEAGPSPSGGSDRTKRAYGAKFWDEKPRRIVAVETESGKTRWTRESRVLAGHAGRQFQPRCLPRWRQDHLPEQRQRSGTLAIHRGPPRRRNQVLLSANPRALRQRRALLRRRNGRGTDRLLVHGGRRHLNGLIPRRRQGDLESLSSTVRLSLPRRPARGRRIGLDRRDNQRTCRWHVHWPESANG